MSNDMLRSFENFTQDINRELGRTLNQLGNSELPQEVDRMLDELDESCEACCFDIIDAIQEAFEKLKEAFHSIFSSNRHQQNPHENRRHENRRRFNP